MFDKADFSGDLFNKLEKILYLNVGKKDWGYENTLLQIQFLIGFLRYLGKFPQDIADARIIS